MTTDIKCFISRLKFTVDEIVSKIRSLRTTYMRELGKVNASKRTGSGKEGVYVSRWKYFTTLDAFLRLQVTSRKLTAINMVCLFTDIILLHFLFPSCLAMSVDIISKFIPIICLWTCSIFVCQAFLLYS